MFIRSTTDLPIVFLLVFSSLCRWSLSLSLSLRITDIFYSVLPSVLFHEVSEMGTFELVEKQFTDGCGALG